MNKILGIVAVEQDDFFPFGKQTFYFEDLINSSPELEVDFFVFSPLKWELNSDIIEGYYYKDNKWTKSFSSFPKIIYDRAFAKSKEDKQKIEDFRKYLIQSQTKVLNPVLYAELLNNKIEFHKFLEKNKISTISALPTNYILTDNFKNDISNGGEYYLKPNFGTGGFGIYVINSFNDKFILRNFTNTSFNEFNTIKELFEYCSFNIFCSENYFIQKKANIIPYKNCPFDIRVIVQNFGNKEYKITGYGVRLGLEKSNVSNLNSGGTAIPLEELEVYYLKNFNKNIVDEIKNIENICTNCCQFLHNEFGSFLEIGFDILLTIDGPIILEGNSKPSRWIFNVLSDFYKNDLQKQKEFKKLRKLTVKVPVIFTNQIKYSN